jgi:hypothetical protein
MHKVPSPPPYGHHENKKAYKRNMINSKWPPAQQPTDPGLLTMNAIEIHGQILIKATESINFLHSMMPTLNSYCYCSRYRADQARPMWYLRAELCA